MAKKTHPFSEAQRRWAFAAEARGELPKGTALAWARRAKHRRSSNPGSGSLDTWQAYAIAGLFAIGLAFVVGRSA